MVCHQRAPPSNAASADGLPVREPRDQMRSHVRQATTVGRGYDTPAGDSGPSALTPKQCRRREWACSARAKKLGAQTREHSDQGAWHVARQDSEHQQVMIDDGQLRER
eukprot:scaffold1167_cov31-Tisochrysis_lutea.AAC.1